MSGINAADAERQPLLNGSQSALASTRPDADYHSIEQAQEQDEFDEAAAAQESAFVAIQDAAHGVDPNSSAFAPRESQFSNIAGDASRISIRTAAGEVPAGPSLSSILVILGAMWVGTFLAALDSTIVAVALTAVSSEFKVSKEISWLGTSYLLTQTAFQPLFGKASDIFGRRPVALFGSAIFLVGSLCCGLAQTFGQLCAARAFAGIGGGSLTTLSTIVTADLVPLKQRGTFQGLGNLVFATGAALGGPLGGLFIDAGWGWRWSFLIQVPLCCVHFGVVLFKVKIPAGPGSMIEKIKRIDALGAFTLVSSVTLLLVALSIGGNQREWSDPIVLGTLVAGLVGAVAFALVEKYVAREPLMPLSVLFRRTPGSVALMALFVSVAQFALLYNIPLYFSAVEQTSNSYGGLHLIPNSIFASATSLGSGLIMARTGRYKTMLLTVSAIGTLGPLGFIFWQRGQTPSWLQWLEMPTNGVAYGGVLTITLVGLIASIDPKDMSAATGMVYLFRAVGSISGVSLSQALLQLVLKRRLAAAGLPKKIISHIRDDVTFIHKLPRGLRIKAIDSYDAALHAVFVGTFVSAVLAFCVSFFIQEFPLPGSPTKPAAPVVTSASAPPREQTIAEEEEEEAN